jgi:hypothetical protein
MCRICTAPAKVSATVYMLRRARFLTYPSGAPGMGGIFDVAAALVRLV